MELDNAYALCLKHGDTCFDVGANFGQTATVLSRLVGPTGVCISFECHPLIYARLSVLASKPGNENIRPHCRALSDTVGHTIMHAGKDVLAYQASTIVPELAIQRRLGNDIFQLRVETDTLDRYCSQHGYRPQMVKLDVEGAEEQVFAGAIRTLQECQPHVVFEFGHGFDTGRIPTHFKTLTELGYVLTIVDLQFYRNRPSRYRQTDDALVAVTADDILRTALTSGNILAVHRSKSESVFNRVRMLSFAEAETLVAA
jgi:FkbM family methyltransferase